MKPERKDIQIWPWDTLAWNTNNAFHIAEAAIRYVDANSYYTYTDHSKKAKDELHIAWVKLAAAVEHWRNPQFD